MHKRKGKIHNDHHSSHSTNNLYNVILQSLQSQGFVASDNVLGHLPMLQKASWDGLMPNLYSLTLDIPVLHLRLQEREWVVVLQPYPASIFLWSCFLPKCLKLIRRCMFNSWTHYGLKVFIENYLAQKNFITLPQHSVTLISWKKN